MNRHRKNGRVSRHGGDLHPRIKAMRAAAEFQRAAPDGRYQSDYSKSPVLHGVGLVPGRFALLEWLAIAGGVVVALFVAWRIVSLTAAISLSGSDPRGALAWDPSNAAALDSIAFQELSKQSPNLASAEAVLQKSLRGNPLDARALALLGIAADKRGDAERARLLVGAAGRQTWRDQVSQVWLFNTAVKSENYAEALRHLDALMRLDESRDHFFALAASFTLKPNSSAALADFLATSPAWRTWFLSQLSTRLRDTSALSRLFSALRAGPTPPNREELSSYLDRLISGEQYELAYSTWKDSLPPAVKKNVGYVYNGDFNLPLDRLPFNWRFEDMPTSTFELVEVPGSLMQRALRLEFSGARLRFASPKQLLLLKPGTWRLSGEVKPQALQTERGLRWTLVCAATGGRSLGSTDFVTGTSDWRPFSATFTVRADCPAQWLELEHPARVASEEPIRGSVSYRSIRIEPGQS